MTSATARVGLVTLTLCVAACDDGSVPGTGSAAGGLSAAAWFTEITGESGFAFVHDAGAKGRFWLPEIMGPGLALLDYDGDGDLDCYLVNGNDTLPEGRPGGADGPRNVLLRREDDGTYADVTDASGLGDVGYGMGVAVGDVDNDGDADVYVTNFGPDRLYRNDGDGTFTDVSGPAGIDVGGWSCSAAFLDFDRDGFLDLYVTQYVDHDPERRCADHAGRPDYCSPDTYAAVPDVLLRNDGDGTFTDVSATAGIASAAAAGLGVVCEDLDDDGWIDVYVANDGDPNHLWINGGDGTFRDQAVVRGAAYNLHGVPEAGMGVIAADFQNREVLDLFVTHLASESNTLYRRRDGNVDYDDVTGSRGLAAASMTSTGFGTAALDVELDGDLDLLVVNGRVLQQEPRPDSDAGPPWDRYAEPNLCFINDGTGSFELAPAAAASSWSGPVEVSRGLAAGDIDGDGDLDVLVSNVQGPARLYRNDAPREGSWLLVRCVDPALGRDAIGARVVVRCGERRFMRTITRAFSYLSSSPPIAHFGLGRADRIDAIDVRWPDGTNERFGPFEADAAVQLVRGTGS